MSGTDLYDAVQDYMRTLDNATRELDVIESLWEEKHGDRAILEAFESLAGDLGRFRDALASVVASAATGAFGVGMRMSDNETEALASFNQSVSHALSAAYRLRPTLVSYVEGLATGGRIDSARRVVEAMRKVRGLGGEVVRLQRLIAVAELAGYLKARDLRPAEALWNSVRPTASDMSEALTYGMLEAGRVAGGEVWLTRAAELGARGDLLRQVVRGDALRAWKFHGYVNPAVERHAVPGDVRFVGVADDGASVLYATSDQLVLLAAPGVTAIASRTLDLRGPAINWMGEVKDVHALPWGFLVESMYTQDKPVEVAVGAGRPRGGSLPVHARFSIAALTPTLVKIAGPGGESVEVPIQEACRASVSADGRTLAVLHRERVLTIASVQG